MAPLKRLNDGFSYTSRSAMRDQVTLTQPSASNNPDGSPGDPTVFMQNVWANCRVWRNGREANASELVQGEVYWIVNTPYIAGVTDQMNMIGPNGQNWFIVTVSDPDQRQVELRFLCREINGGGAVSEVAEFVEGGQF